MCTVWPSHSQWLSEQINFITTLCLPILQLSCRIFFCKTSHHSGLLASLQPRFGSLRLLVFPKAKIAVEREEICECDRHTVHKLGQRRLTAEWLAPRDSDYSRMCSKVSYDWLPSYIRATWPVLKIFKMAGYFPDNTRIVKLLVSSNDNINDWGNTERNWTGSRHYHHWRLMSHAITGAQPTTEQKKCNSGPIIQSVSLDLDIFEMWCRRRMENIRRTYCVTIEEILHTANK